jgi:predicted N-acyltransferase
LGGKGFNFLEKILLQNQSGILICGNLFHLEGKGFYFENSRDESLIFKILNHYEKRAAKKASLILIKDAGVDFDESIPEEYKYRKFEKDWMMEILIQPEWENFDSYLGSLSKKYRQRAAKIRAARELLEVRFLSLEEISLMNDHIAVLYRNVRQKQTFRPGELNALYFLNMKKNLGNDFQILAYFKDGEMIAFSSHIRHSGNRLEVHYIGIDYTLNEKYCLYFNILFDGIRVAIENRNSKLLLGRTGYDAKASAGAVPVAGQHYLRLKRGIPSLGFRYFSSNLAGTENLDWQKRSPFKETTPIQEPNLV